MTALIRGVNSLIHRNKSSIRERFSTIEARSSGGERYLDTVEVVGSNPIVPTSEIKGLRVILYPLFYCFLVA